MLAEQPLPPPQPTSATQSALRCLQTKERETQPRRNGVDTSLWLGLVLLEEETRNFSIFYYKFA